MWPCTEAAMIDLNSLKEQLKLLGHALPDDQILSILKEMNIEVAAAEGKRTSGNCKRMSAGRP